MAVPPKVDWMLKHRAEGMILNMTGAELEALEAFWDALADGDIRSRRVIEDGRVRESLTAAYWQDENKRGAGSHDRTDWKAGIEIHRGDLLRWLSPSTNEARRRPGAPPKWDWEAFWVEAVLLANTPDGLPNKQADFETRMAEWFEDQMGDSPAESTIREKAGRLYQTKADK